MTPPRVRIIPFLHGKMTRDGKLSEPDIYDILERWLERHAQIRARQRDLQISRGRLTLPGGVRTELVGVTIAWCKTLPATTPPRTSISTSIIWPRSRGVAMKSTPCDQRHRA